MFFRTYVCARFQRKGKKKNKKIIFFLHSFKSRFIFASAFEKR